MIKIFMFMFCLLVGLLIGFFLWGKDYNDIWQEGYEKAKNTYSDYKKGFEDGYECAGDIIINTAYKWTEKDIINIEEIKQKKRQEGQEG